jgi:hypothetical protein
LCNRKAVGKAQDIKDDSIVAGAVDGRFIVSSSNSEPSYQVDVQRGFCDCYVGACGACCKHQIAVANKEGVVLPNIPIVTTPEQRIALCRLALGQNSLGASFFGSVTAVTAGKWLLMQSFYQIQTINIISVPDIYK